jgi:hypothetical protein
MTQGNNGGAVSDAEGDAAYVNGESTLKLEPFFEGGEAPMDAEDMS